MVCDTNVFKTAEQLLISSTVPNLLLSLGLSPHTFLFSSQTCLHRVWYLLGCQGNTRRSWAIQWLMSMVSGAAVERTRGTRWISFYSSQHKENRMSSEDSELHKPDHKSHPINHEEFNHSFDHDISSCLNEDEMSLSFFYYDGVLLPHVS